MAFSAFSTLYNPNLLIGGLIPSSTVSIPSSSFIGTRQLEAVAANGDGSKKRVLDPFDPAASVPLPHQLDDQFGNPFATTVWKRNERERFRVRCVNEGYERLRQHLPIGEADKRISKVDTLRLAIRYIRHLDALLKEPSHPTRCACFRHFREESEGQVTVDFRGKNPCLGMGADRVSQ